MVVGVSVTPANSPDDTGMVEMIDDTIDRLGSAPEAVCADAAYGSGKNRASLKKLGVRLVSPPKRPKTYTGDDQFTTEDFVYDKSKNEFVCPAGKRSKYMGDETDSRHRRRYAASRSECGVCDWKLCCTRYSRRELKVGLHHSALIELRADSKTESFKRLGALYWFILQMKQHCENLLRVIWRNLSEPDRRIQSQIIAYTFAPAVLENRA
ncbi:MAG: transposase [Candidatus Zixiibacteriota bacterium]